MGGEMAIAISCTAILLFGIWIFVDGYFQGAKEPGHICPNCHSIIKPREVESGSGWITLLLLFFFVVPAIIYSFWRSSTRKNTCPTCGAPNPVPLSTPAGQAIAAKVSGS